MNAEQLLEEYIRKHGDKDGQVSGEITLPINSVIDMLKEVNELRVSKADLQHKIRAVRNQIQAAIETQDIIDVQRALKLLGRE